MLLSVNLRHLEKKPVPLDGEASAEELDIKTGDQMVRPVKVFFDLEVEKMDRNLLIQGELGVELECACVRCLKEFKQEMDWPDWVCHVPLEGEDAAPVLNDCVDLTPFIREDILLGLPQHPLCQADCRGLPGRPAGKTSRLESTGRSDRSSSAWSELNKLKLEE
jgi:uncharacterized protein